MEVDTGQAVCLHSRSRMLDLRVSVEASSTEGCVCVVDRGSHHPQSHSLLSVPAV